jgi:hypothetical protein
MMMKTVPLNEDEAWERMRAAILRCQRDPTEANHAEVRRCSRALTAAMTGGSPDDVVDEAA